MPRIFHCIMGCPEDGTSTHHNFPENPKRRAEWCRILGVNPKVKRVDICGDHFDDCYKYGNRLSHFAVPNPPDKTIRQKNKKINKKHKFYLDLDSLQNSVIGFHKEQTAATTNNVLPTQISVENTDRKVVENDVHIPHLDTINSDCKLEDQKCSSSNENNGAVTEHDKTEDFEIRKRDTNELIVQLRRVETENTRVLSFILPQKIALQKIIKSRDIQCDRQFREIKRLKNVNARLFKQLNIYRVAILQWRHIKAINRYLRFRLKKYMQRVISLKKKLKTVKRVMKLWNEFCVDSLVPKM